MFVNGVWNNYSWPEDISVFGPQRVNSINDQLQFPIQHGQ